MFGQSGIQSSSARFANVAFSGGSLLESWVTRMNNLEPIAVPTDTKRYFITPSESGDLCLLAAFANTGNQIYVPNYLPDTHLYDLVDTLECVLANKQLQPVYFTDEVEASANSVSLRAKNQQAVIKTSRDTVGEKPFEEFVAVGESYSTSLMTGINCIDPILLNQNSLDTFISNVNRAYDDPENGPGLADLIDEISNIVPNFHHVSSTDSLDNRR